MEEFAPILLFLFFWIFIGLPVSIAKKTADRKKSAGPAAKKTAAGNQSPGGPIPAGARQLTTLTPTVYEPDHDDSVFTGSLGSVSTEGYDPCHEEQLNGMELVCQPGKEVPETKAVSGLPFGWTGSDMVRGIVMSEILNRKH